MTFDEDLESILQNEGYGDYIVAETDSISEGSTVPLNPDTITNEITADTQLYGDGLELNGNEFKGWFTEPNGKGIKFEFGDSGTILSRNHITYLDGWEAVILYPYATKMHTVDFDTDGDGTADPDKDIEVEDGTGVDKDKVPSIVPTPDKWVDQDGNEYDFDDPATPDEDEGTPVDKDITLTPVYIVKFEDGNGNVDTENGTNPPQDVEINGYVSDPTNPQTGKGEPDLWYVDKNGNDKYDVGEEWDFDNDKVTESMTLVPFWEHKVDFDTDGDGNPDTGKDVTVEDGTSVDKTDVPDVDNIPDKWVDQDGNEYDFDDPATPDEDEGTPVDKDITLTPVYIVKFEDGNGNVDTENGTNPPQDVEINGYVSDPTNPQTGKGEPDLWYVDKNGNDKYDVGEEWDFDNDKVTESMTLVPFWEHKVDFDTDGDGNPDTGKDVTVEDGTSVDKTDVPDVDNIPDKWVDQDGNEYDFDDPNTDVDEGTPVEKDIILTPVYKVEFEDGNGNIDGVNGTNPPQEVEVGGKVTTPKDPTKGEPEFWFEDKNNNGKFDEGDVKWDFETSVVEKNTVLTPQYEHTITFEGKTDGDENSDDDDFKKDIVDDGDKVTKPTDFPEDPNGGHPDEWYVEDPDTGERKPFDFNDPVDEDVTLYPHYKYDVNVYDSYAASNGTGTYKPGETVTINAGSRAGYTFGGWTVTFPNGGSVTINLADQWSATTTFTMPNVHVNITANWTQNETGAVATPAPTATPTPSPSASPTPTATPTPEPSATPEPEEPEATDEEASATPTPAPSAIPLPNIDDGNGGEPMIPEKVEIGGEELGENDYNIDENGNLTINPDYIATLPDGEHEIVITLNGEEYTSVVIVDGGIATSASAFQKTGGGWSLFDLLMTVVAIVLALLYMVMRPRKDDEEDERYREESEKEEEKRKKRVFTSIMLLAFAIFSVILLFITQDFTQPMIIFDIWSIIFAVVAVIQVVIMFIIRKKNEESEEYQTYR